MVGSNLSAVLISLTSSQGLDTKKTQDVTKFFVTIKNHRWRTLNPSLSQRVSRKIWQISWIKLYWTIRIAVDFCEVIVQLLTPRAESIIISYKSTVNNLTVKRIITEICSKQRFPFFPRLQFKLRALENRAEGILIKTLRLCNSLISFFPTILGYYIQETLNVFLSVFSEIWLSISF